MRVGYALRIRIAAKAEVDPRTVVRVLTGLSTRGNARARVLRVLAEEQGVAAATEEIARAVGLVTEARQEPIRCVHCGVRPEEHVWPERGCRTYVIGPPDCRHWDSSGSTTEVDGDGRERCRNCGRTWDVSYA
jgi:hypothetical protein